MYLEERISAFAELGAILRASVEGKTSFSEKLEILTESQHYKNPWFTPVNVRHALSSVAKLLTTDNLRKWTGPYLLPEENNNPATIGIIMAGNIPLVGFHDYLSVLITGNKLVAKTSSRDPDLVVFLTDILCSIDSRFSQHIKLSAGTISDFDAVIATGSDNSSRYFEYYFGKYPHIIRKNRNSVAILDGSERGEELEALGNDIFSYFGLGCRSVSKLYLPDGYRIEELPGSWKKWENLAEHSKYANNLDFNKAVYLVNREKFHDGVFVLLREEKRLSSPVGVLYYEYYSKVGRLREELEAESNKIQCIVSRDHTPFGHAQMPDLWDYADGADTIEFLSEKNILRNIIK
jgi:hypothetical protein